MNKGEDNPNMLDSIKNFESNCKKQRSNNKYNVGPVFIVDHQSIYDELINRHDSRYVFLNSNE